MLVTMVYKDLLSTFWTLSVIIASIKPQRHLMKETEVVFLDISF
jgi:hypothetical protein